jgi:uncharacterized protein YggE
VRTARRAAAGLALALAAPAAAQIRPPGPLRGVTATAVRTAPLAPGEVLLELGAIGVAAARADLATITITVGAEAPAFEDAQRLYRARLARIREALRGAGLPADAVQAGEDQPPGSHPPSFGTASNIDNYWAGDVVIIEIADIDRVAAVRAALDAAGVARDESAPIYSVSDFGAALRTARVRAIAKIRADADAYAAARGMRVARIMRVTERNGTDLYRLAYGQAQRFRRGEGNMFTGREASADIDTGVAVSVDFALAPL